MENWKETHCFGKLVRKFCRNIRIHRNSKLGIKLKLYENWTPTTKGQSPQIRLTRTVFHNCSRTSPFQGLDKHNTNNRSMKCTKRTVVNDYNQIIFENSTKMDCFREFNENLSISKKTVRHASFFEEWSKPLFSNISHCFGELNNNSDRFRQLQQKLLLSSTGRN